MFDLRKASASLFVVSLFVLGGCSDDEDSAAESTWVSQEQAYEEFLEQFAGRPEVTHGVRPEALPPSYRVRTAGRDQDSIRTTAEHFEDRAGVYRVVHHLGQAMSVIDWHVRPLTSPMSMQSSAFTVGLAGIDLSGTAPSEMSEPVRALEALWDDPHSASEAVREEAVDAARQIAAFYDTECR